MTPEERKENAGLTIVAHSFQDATYVRKIELKIKSKDLQNPNEQIHIKFFAECMQHKNGRITTSVTRVLQYEDGKIMWFGKKFECLNYHVVLEEIKRMYEQHIKENKNELVK